MPDAPDPYGYNTIPYPAAPYPYSHPDHLAMLGTLLGLSPPDVNHCRVLEIGCADGANLLPMALALPRSKCVGIDLADQQVTQGETVRRALGLANATLSCENLDTWEPSEPFDYIIAHGFYSWTPAATREALRGAVSGSREESNTDTPAVRSRTTTSATVATASASVGGATRSGSSR